MTIERSSRQYADEFSDAGFWEKLRAGIKGAGENVLRIALRLYYSARDPDTPAWAKTTIYSALGYFICTLDAIPDLTPVLGFSDDLGALSLALATVAAFVKPDHIAAADAKMETWFGGSPPPNGD
ncbi:MAG: YkvA family protein [Bradymonadia bacterium]